jgi:sulfoxide reductase heme-binding subunit YedZ
MVSTIPVYIISAVFSGLFLLIAAIISNSIQFQGGSNPKDPQQRKMWFWVMGVLCAISNLLFGLFYYYFPTNSSFAKAKFMTAIGASTGLCFLLYILIGFLLAKMFKHGKLGNWF